jgi:DNA-binding response OmpR family regulator
MRILVIEDNAEMRHSLKITLERESFAVDAASDGREGSYMARTNEYDIIILDNVLPFKNGAEVCDDIRKSGNSTPILFLSVKSEIDDITQHLDLGADDYLAKPYSHKELVSRLKALSRRSRHVENIVFHAGNLVLDSKANEVRLKGKEIYLTRKEFSLLELLLRHKGSVVSRGTILEHVWDIEGDPLSKTVETHILNLRKKIEKGKDKIIFNVPGRGYKIPSM